MTFREFQFLFLLWKMGVVDSFSILKICVNTGSQYAGIVLSSAAGNFSEINSKILLEPIVGLGVGAQYVTAAATSAERHRRIATLASFLATSATTVTADPCTNVALGGVIASKIAYMRAILARGGHSYSYIEPVSKTPGLTSQSTFNSNNKVVIEKMFQQNNNLRYLQHSVREIKTLASEYFVPVLSTSALTSTSTIIAWTCFGGCLFGITVLGSLCLFQRTECNRWKKANDKVVIIDVVSCSND